MSASAKIKFPRGRFVQGDAYKGSDKDAEGKPRVIKDGPNAGQPTVQHYTAVAYDKLGTTDFRQTEWGKQMDSIARQGFPNGQWQHPQFAWKVIDGDSMVPNKNGKRPFEQEGFKGCWVVRFTSQFAPRLLYKNNGVLADLPMTLKMKCGDYVEVWAQVKGNASTNQPGIYVSQDAIFLAAAGEEIATGQDYSQVGFGAEPLPPGLVAPDADQLPAFGNAVGPQPTPNAPDPRSGATVVTPRPDLLGMPPVDDDLPPPPSTGPAMTAKAGGKTREQFHAKGWSDEQLIANGYMVA